MRISAIGRFTTRQSTIEGGSGGKEATAAAALAEVAAIVCVGTSVIEPVGLRLTDTGTLQCL